MDGVREHAMVFALFVVLLVLALVGAASTFLVSSSHAMADDIRTKQAFYLAEAALEAAKWEIGEGADPGGDGVGNTSWTDGSSAYSANAEPRGDSWELSATGVKGGVNVTLVRVLEGRSSSSTPVGALSILGRADLRIAGGKNYGRSGERSLILSGGDSPGITVADSTYHSELGNDFVAKVRADDIDPNNFNGMPMTDWGGVFLPIHHASGASDYLAGLDAVYTGVAAQVQDVLVPSATPFTFGSVGGSYGDLDAPVRLYASGFEAIASGQSVYGHGTLIVDCGLEVKSDATLHWVGDIVIVGDKAARVKVRGNLIVDGNLLILGGRKASLLHFTDGAQVDVRGALTALSSSSSGGTVIRSDGEVRVLGMVSVFGRKTAIVFQKDSSTTIVGIMQIGFPSLTAESYVRFDGDFESQKSDEWIEEGLKSLRAFQVELGLTDGLVSDSSTLEAVFWGRMY